MAHVRSRQRRADQTRPTIADQLDRATDRIDALTHRVRLAGDTLSPAAYHDAEAEAQSIAAAIVGAFRGPRLSPTNPPRYISADGQKAGW